MDDEDQKFMEEFYKNNIMNKINDDEDDKSDISYNSDDNDFDFNSIENDGNLDLIIKNEEIIKEKVIEIKWKYKKIEQIEKLLNRYNISNEGLLILKDLPNFNDLTDEQKFYELKKNKFRLYNNVNFDKNNYEKLNPNGLFVAGDGRLNKKKRKEMRMKKMQKMHNMMMNVQQVQNNNFMGFNLKRK